MESLLQVIKATAAGRTLRHGGAMPILRGTVNAIICSTQTMTRSTPRLTNLAAAFALAATDGMLATIEACAMIAGAPAALTTILAFPADRWTRCAGYWV